MRVVVGAPLGRVRSSRQHSINVLRKYVVAADRAVHAVPAAGRVHAGIEHLLVTNTAILLCLQAQQKSTVNDDPVLNWTRTCTS